MGFVFVFVLVFVLLKTIVFVYLFVAIAVWLLAAPLGIVRMPNHCFVSTALFEKLNVLYLFHFSRAQETKNCALVTCWVKFIRTVVNL